MKNILITTAIVCCITACNNGGKTDSETKKEIVADTSTNFNNSVLTDTGNAVIPEIAPVVPVKAVPAVTKKNTTVKKYAAPAPIKSSPAPVTTPAATTDNTATQSTANTEPVAAPVEEKKGWSKAAKGAVIGGGAGAIGGAIISKKKGKGAIIGGVLGAGAGYIIGRKKDKNDTLK